MNNFEANSALLLVDCDISTLKQKLIIAKFAYSLKNERKTLMFIY